MISDHIFNNIDLFLLTMLMITYTHEPNDAIPYQQISKVTTTNLYARAVTETPQFTTFLLRHKAHNGIGIESGEAFLINPWF